MIEVGMLHQQMSNRQRRHWQRKGKKERHNFPGGKLPPSPNLVRKLIKLCGSEVSLFLSLSRLLSGVCAYCWLVGSCTQFSNNTRNYTKYDTD